MTTYDHINELRAELAAAIDQAAFDALISAEPRH